MELNPPRPTGVIRAGSIGNRLLITKGAHQVGVPRGRGEKKRPGFVENFCQSAQNTRPQAKLQIMPAA